MIISHKSTSKNPVHAASCFSPLAVNTTRMVERLTSKRRAIIISKGIITQLKTSVVINVSSVIVVAQKISDVI
jgi:hypothetical protein